jgi:hypothetical protein
MSQSDFDAQVQRWIAEEYEKQWAESLAQIDEAAIHQIAQVEATKRVRAEMERPSGRHSLTGARNNGRKNTPMNICRHIDQTADTRTM